MDKTIEALRQERDRFVAFSFASADILIELDEKGTILFIDGAVSGLLGCKADDLVGSSFISLVREEQAHRIHDMLTNELNEDRIDHQKVYLRSPNPNGVPFALSGYKLGTLKNHYYLALTYLKDFTSPEDLLLRAKGTNLYKKETFAETATRKIQEFNRKGEKVKVTLLDLPEFKAMISDLPRDKAQSLLYEINDYLRHNSLDGDLAGIVEEGAYSLILDPKVTPEHVAEKIFEITRRADPQGKGIHARTEVVSSESPNLTDTDCANALLYTINLFARTHGEEFRITSLSDGYESMLEETVRKISDFKNTVEGGKFQLAFQPIVDLKNGINHHYEVLVRFESDTMFENPFSFISFGEEAGMIGEFDLAMCQRAIDVLAEWRGNGTLPKVAVNLSGKSLSSNLYMDALRRITGYNPEMNKQLIFEITESAKIADFGSANDFLQEMRGKGFLCCLDDFGVGESSFNYLRNLHVDFVKIDGSYVRESVATPRGQHLLRAMAGMCKELGITTIGEMVEDEKVAMLLWESGVHFGQGYYFGKPNTDVKTLAACSQPNAHYHGVMRARTFR